MKLVTVAEMRAIEAEANQNGLSYEEMMQRAGQGVAQVVLDTYGQDFLQTVVGLVGPGNNGGDALVALTELAREGWQAMAYLVKARSEGDPLVKDFVESGGRVLLADDDPDFAQLYEWLDPADVLIDGVLGTGIELPLRPQIANILSAIKEREELPPVVAVDCPSGINSDTGEAADEAIPADITVCMAAVKEGLLKFPAFSLIGDLTVVDLEFPEGLENWEKVDRFLVTEERVRLLLPDRPADSHKGTFGTALLAVGSIPYTGAALLAGMAAYRSGTGLVRLAVPGPLHTALAGHIPEATWLLLPHEMGVIGADAAEVIYKNLDRVTAMLLGCGWGTEETTADFLNRLLKGQARRANRVGIGFISERREEEKANTKLPPLVIDADALRLLAKIDNWPELLSEPAVLTPHPGEMSILTGLSTEEIQSDRFEIARKYAKQWKQVVVLKGAITVVSDPEGSLYVVPVATAALAHAGTGDVLAGLITGLRAQGLSAIHAAIAGAFLHAQAGMAVEELYGGSASVLATDVLEMLPEIIQQCQD